jgi:hypothetical protein
VDGDWEESDERISVVMCGDRKGVGYSKGSRLYQLKFNETLRNVEKEGKL